MGSHLLLCVTLLAAGCRALPSLPSSAAELETFEPEPRVVTLQHLLVAIDGRLRDHDERLTDLQQQQRQQQQQQQQQQQTLSGQLDRLTELQQQQTLLAGQMKQLLRQLSEYPNCEQVTVENGPSQFRLVGDASCSRGRLQWRKQGYVLWHQLCDSTEWSRQDAEVACRSLGFRAGAPGVDVALVGSADEGYARSFGITCGGSEAHLWKCRLENERRHSDGCPAGTTAVKVTCSSG